MRYWLSNVYRLTKINRSKRYRFWTLNCQNRLKYTKICKPRYRSIFFYLLNHRFIDLEILQIPKSPFLLMVFEFFHVFHIESDSIDLISICKPRYWSIFFTYRKHWFIELVILQIPKKEGGVLHALPCNMQKYNKKYSAYIQY